MHSYDVSTSKPLAKQTYTYTWLSLPVQLLYQALTDETKASTTVNQVMDPIAQGTSRKAHLKKKQWFLF